jgi:hypothetical protein
MDLAKIVRELLRDGAMFVELSKSAKREGNVRLEKCYGRAAIFASWSALEGWVNYACSDFSKLSRDKMTLWEQAFLKERRVEIDKNGEFRISSQADFHPTSFKLCFLFRRFGGYRVREENEKLWSDFKEIENLRNLLVHPSSEKQELKVDANTAEKAMDTTKTLVMLLKDKIYHKK